METCRFATTPWSSILELCSGCHVMGWGGFVSMLGGCLTTELVEWTVKGSGRLLGSHVEDRGQHVKVEFNSEIKVRILIQS